MWPPRCAVRKVAASSGRVVRIFSYLCSATVRQPALLRAAMKRETGENPVQSRCCESFFRHTLHPPQRGALAAQAPRARPTHAATACTRPCEPGKREGGYERGQARRPAAAVAHQGRATPEEGQAYSPFIYTLFLRSQARTPCGLRQRLAAREPQVLAFPEIRGYAWRGLTRKRHLRRRAAQGFPLEGKTAGDLCAAA